MKSNFAEMESVAWRKRAGLLAWLVIGTVPFLSLFGQTKSSSGGVTVLRGEVKSESVSRARATLYCRGAMGATVSSLADDKRRITIEIPQVSAGTLAQQIAGEGVIENGFVTRIGTKAMINLNLTESKGFTTVWMPYSQTFVVDVFNWSELKTAESAYRNGLLALENGLLGEAKKYFKRSADKGFADASLQLGFLEIAQEHSEEALELLLSAIAEGSTSIDAQAALGQVYTMRNNPERALHCQKIFREKSGIAQIGFIPPLPESAFFIAPNSLDELNPSLISEIFTDTTTTATTAAISIIDSAESQIILPKPETESPRHSTASTEGGLPGWMKTAMWGGGALVALWAVYFGTMYVKWRKRVVEEQMVQSVAEVSSEPAGDFISTLNNLQVQPIQSKRERNREIDGSEFAERGDQSSFDVGDVDARHFEDDDYLDDELVESDEWADDSEPEYKQVASIFGSSQGKVDFALGIKNEHLRKKTDALNQMTSDGLSGQGYSFSEKAKRMGIDKGSLEAKKSVSSYSSEPDRRSLLQTKFSVEE